MPNRILSSLTSRELKFFDVAKSVARTSTYHGTHVGCCVVYKGLVVSVASNSNNMNTIYDIFPKFKIYTNPKIDKFAESYAISILDGCLVNKGKIIDWSKVSVYVYREFRNNKPVVSKPCSEVYSMFKKLGISTIYYIDKSGCYVKEML